ncbi:hypothetical protein CB1_000641001 [Camelus ferus]|nr:hypothetical protein CB1_000641001 [Camelus ferus]
MPPSRSRCSTTHGSPMGRGSLLLSLRLSLRSATQQSFSNTPLAEGTTLALLKSSWNGPHTLAEMCSEPPGKAANNMKFPERPDHRPEAVSTPKSVLTAGEDQRAGVLIHGEVVQLQLALSVYEKRAKRKNDRLKKERHVETGGDGSHPLPGTGSLPQSQRVRTRLEQDRQIH